MIEREALRKLPILRAIGGTDQTAQPLPQIALRALCIDLLIQRLLFNAPFVVALKHCAKSALLLA